MSETLIMLLLSKILLDVIYHVGYTIRIYIRRQKYRDLQKILAKVLEICFELFLVKVCVTCGNITLNVDYYFGINQNQQNFYKYT